MANLFDAVSSLLSSPSRVPASDKSMCKAVPITLASPSVVKNTSSGELARPVPLSPLPNNILKSPAPHPASFKPVGSPAPHPASFKPVGSPVSGRSSPSFNLSPNGRSVPRAGTSPSPVAMLECRLTYVDSPGKGIENLVRVFDAGVPETIGSSDFHCDACLSDEHIRATFNERKGSLTIELISNTPAYVFRKGSPNKQLLAKGKPVELFNLDRFTMIHDLHPVQVEITPQAIVRTPSTANRLTSIKNIGNDAERTGLLGDGERTTLTEFKDTPTAF